MEAEKQILHQRYIRLQESKLNSDDGADIEEAAMRPLVTQWLKIYRDAGRQFEMCFCQIVSHIFHSEPPSSFNSLQKAFEIFEKICINLLIYPWRKEFKRIKIFAPAFVHYVWPAMSKVNSQQLLTTIGYSLEQEAEVYCYRGPDQPQHLKALAFDFLLAQLECERLMETISHVRISGHNELETVKDTRQEPEGATGCPSVLEEREKGTVVLKPIKMSWKRSQLEPSCKLNSRKPNKLKTLASKRVNKDNSCFLSSSEIEKGHHLLLSLRTTSVLPAGIASEIHCEPNKEGLNGHKGTLLESEPVKVGKDVLLKRKKSNLPTHLLDVERNNLAASFLPCKCQICRTSPGSFVCVRCGLAACPRCSTQIVIPVPYRCEHEFQFFSRRLPMDTC